MKRMTRLSTLSLAIGLTMLFFGSGTINLKAQQEPKKEEKKKQEGLITDWINDFEDCEDWRAVSTCPLGDTKTRKIPGKPKPVNDEGKEVDDNGNAGKYPDQSADDNGLTHKNENVLGVKTYYLDRGFDRVEVFPPNEYIIRGKAREFKFWALGRKFRHTIWIKLRDYRGEIHKLKVGRLDFWGWKEMSVIVPGWLPQSASYALLDKNLHFVSFFIESDLYEIPGTFYTYIDQFRVVTDLSEFTGDETIKDTW
jgi:hypothetical protein